MRHVILLLRLSIALSIASLTGCSQSNAPLLTGLPETEANLVLAALAEHDIPARKTEEKGGTQGIEVPSDRLVDALQQLRNYGLPRRNFSTIADVFKNDSMVSSPLQEHARYIYALAQELEKTLSQMDDVIYVSVHPVLPQKTSLTSPTISASAGVFIKHRPDATLEHMVPAIRDLVAASIPDLDPGRIAVVLTPAEERWKTLEPRGKDVASAGFFGWGVALVVIGIMGVVGYVLYRTHVLRSRRPADASA